MDLGILTRISFADASASFYSMYLYKVVGILIFDFFLLWNPFFNPFKKLKKMFATKKNNETRKTLKDYCLVLEYRKIIIYAV